MQKLEAWNRAFAEAQNSRVKYANSHLKYVNKNFWVFACEDTS